MGKRKREEADEELSVKQRRVQHKLKLGVTKIGHAFKVCKGFERQKLGRRQKNAAAQSNDKDVERIDSEIAALKALDTTASAQQHFYKSLLKIKEVSDHPNLPSEVKNILKTPSDSATLNVNARLCKSNQVREALAAALDDIQQALGLRIEKSKPKKAPRLRAADFDDEAPSATQLDSSSVPRERKALSAQQDEDDSFPSFDDESGNDDHELLYHKAEDSSDQGAAEDDEVEALERQLAAEGFKPRSSKSKPSGYSFEADLSMSESESETRSASPEHSKASVSKKASFLPSLTMGGYVAGSASDTEDDIDTAPRKNRRGQRARQQIWEQKFGSKAKHLQRQDRGKGWDPKRGAVDGDGNRSSRRLSQRGGRSNGDHSARGNGEGLNGGAAAEVKKKHRDDGGPIHPSWQAAKKAKEIKTTPVAFQGKKITFD